MEHLKGKKKIVLIQAACLEDQNSFSVNSFCKTLDCFLDLTLIFCSKEGP